MNKNLSIIVPSYNMEKYLPKCLGSLVIDNTELLQKLDVIVVNDGSKDRTSEIAHDFEAKYPGVFRVIDKPNGHYGSCVNAALPVAFGAYVKILDADDYVDTVAFEEFCRLAEKELSKGDDGADLLVSNYQEVNPDGNVIKNVNYGLEENHGYYALDECQNMENRFTVQSIAYRTKNVRDMGYRQTEGVNYTDTEWIIEPMTQVRRFVFQKAPMTCYLVGRDGQSTGFVFFMKNFQQVVNVTMGMVERYEQYNGICVEAAKGYYYTQIKKMIEKVYYYWFRGWKGMKCKIDIDEFERCISQNAYYLDLTEKLFVRLGKWHYYFVRDWRQHHSIFTIRRMTFKLLWPISHLIHQILHCLFLFWLSLKRNFSLHF